MLLGDLPMVQCTYSQTWCGPEIYPTTYEEALQPPAIPQFLPPPVAWVTGESHISRLKLGPELALRLKDGKRISLTFMQGRIRKCLTFFRDLYGIPVCLTFMQDGIR